MSRVRMPWLTLLAAMAPFCGLGDRASAQSPELSMREFSSGQIKKGVRSIGFGGDGATWGNYALVYRDADTALVDYGDTHYTNGNDFHFSAVGLTTADLWHGLAVYAIAMFQGTNDVHFNARSPGLGPAAVPLVGKGSDDAIFVKIAMPVTRGISVGGLLSHETSQFNAAPGTASTLQTVHYQTRWRPSGGFGLTWQPDKKMLFGFRGLLNNDLEQRTDPLGLTQGKVHSAEFRLGGSYLPWKGAVLDVGGTRLERRNALAGTHTLVYHPNLGFEQALLQTRLVLRAGVDETSPTAGFSFKFNRFKLDAAYVDNMARSRVANLFGMHSNSVLFTFTVDYSRPKCPQSKEPCRQSSPPPKS
ncbi:MAG TPA: hypothetical protein VKW06_21360 [Candidatus Angelobacter sp.]|nr:hypothetical protein [Candidatus Angelobacter sp.]